MATHDEILRLTNTLMAAGLVGENYRVVRKKKKKMRDIIGLGGKNIVGSALIKSNAEFLGG